MPELVQSKVAQEIVVRYDALISYLQGHLPKVDSKLLMSLLARLKEKPDRLPIFTIEVFTRLGTDQVAASKMITEKTGKVPAVYDRGTHYVTDQPLSLEILEEISADQDVISIKGDPLDIGGSRGPAHDL
jgi:hypothetical protein